MSQSLRLLLVEGDDDMAFLMRKSLERAGHQVMTCATAADAVFAVRHGNFDLITLDQRLPDACGVDLLKALRREGIQTPAIMVTSHNDPALVSQALRAGALDFVVQDRALAFLAELPERVVRAASAGDRDRDTDTVAIQPPTLPAPRMNASDPDCATDTEIPDPLTELPRRAALQAWLKKSCDTARRSGQSLSLLALDLDDFRQLNDQYLLPGGDQLLVAVARLLSSLARPGQWLCRDGGDQFTFVLPGVGAEDALREAERFRLALASASLG
jgi:diguanylate cyclase